MDLAPVYYAASIAASSLAVLRLGIVPAINAGRHRAEARRELVRQVHDLARCLRSLRSEHNATRKIVDAHDRILAHGNPPGR